MDEVVIGIKGIGGEVKEDEIAKKVLRYLPKYYSHKVYAIEESKDLDKYSVDEIFGALTTFEMREFDKEAPKKEETFKASKKIEDVTTNENDEFDEVEGKNL